MQRIIHNFFLCRLSLTLTDVYLLWLVNVLTGLQMAIVRNSMWTGWQPTVPKPVTNVPVPTNTGYCLAPS